jgi:hypothetical protein
MARGDSGRIVIEIDPELKKQLYSVLAREGTTLKDWFVSKARLYVQLRQNPQLSFGYAQDNEEPAS